MNFQSDPKGNMTKSTNQDSLTTCGVKAFYQFKLKMSVKKRKQSEK